jgi:hypothetical protein
MVTNPEVNAEHYAARAAACRGAVAQVVAGGDSSTSGDCNASGSRVVVLLHTG